MTIRFRNRIAPFAPEQLESLAKVLADTEEGLTGSQIGQLLRQSHIPDIDSNNTKWKRLYNAFAAFQNQHSVGNHVIVFMNRTMDPAKFTSDPDKFSRWRDQLNPILILCGMTIGEDGKIRKTTKATTLDDALERANRFKTQLQRRNVHADVLRYADAEIIKQNYFHAVFEAMKSITVKIRCLSGLTSDGSQLVDDAFSLGRKMNPVLAINALNTETLQGEQRGFVNLLKGLYGTIRNPLAHDPKIEWDMSEQDALDVMAMISLIHRKLDNTSKRQSQT
jgi:uncharacterized protein (TIGR02391 family)